MKKLKFIVYEFSVNSKFNPSASICIPFYSMCIWTDHINLENPEDGFSLESDFNGEQSIELKLKNYLITENRC